MSSDDHTSDEVFQTNLSQTNASNESKMKNKISKVPYNSLCIRLCRSQNTVQQERYEEAASKEVHDLQKEGF